MSASEKLRQLDEQATDLREKLAAIEHERWADWQKWMHNRAVNCGDPFGLHFTKSDVDHWNRQINTPYTELHEDEQISDQEQVDRYWPLISPLFDCLPEIRALTEITEHHLCVAAVPENCPTCMALVALERKLEQADHELLITNDTSSSLVVGEQA